MATVQATDHVEGQILFVTTTELGLVLDCVLGEPGGCGLPVALVLKRAQHRLGQVMDGALAHWAHDGTTVQMEVVQCVAGQRVRISGSGTVVVLESVTR